MSTPTTPGSTIDANELLAALKALEAGDFRARLKVGAPGVAGEVAEMFNAHVRRLDQLLAAIRDGSRDMGTEARFYPHLPPHLKLEGAWAETADMFQSGTWNLSTQLHDLLKVIRQHNAGETGARMTVDVHGEMLEIKHHLNALLERGAREAVETT
jgi:hypothetical protein